MSSDVITPFGRGRAAARPGRLRRRREVQRVRFAELHVGCPIIGDVKYGKGEHHRYFREHHGLHRLAPHATELAFDDPHTSLRLRFSVPPTGALRATCAHFEMGQIRARGSSVDPSLTARILWLDLGGSVRGEMTLAGPLFLAAELGAIFPLVSAHIEDWSSSAARDLGTVISREIGLGGNLILRQRADPSTSQVSL